MAGVALAIVVMYGALVLLLNQPGTPTPTPAVIEGQAYDGVDIYDPPRPLQNFTLTNQDQQRVSLSDFAGRPVVLFFGFTHCPDICPATLLDFKRMRIELGDDADQVAFVFVSVDPPRDTPDVLRQKLALFDPAIVGLAGEQAVLDAITPDFDLQVVRIPLDNGGQDDAYTLAHTSNLFIIDREQHLVAEYPFGTPTERVVADLRLRFDL